MSSVTDPTLRWAIDSLLRSSLLVSTLLGATAAAQEEAPQDDAPQEEAPQEEAPQDGVPQDGVPQDDAASPSSLESIQVALAQQAQEIAELKASMAKRSPFWFKASGYFRTRFYLSSSSYAATPEFVSPFDEPRRDYLAQRGEKMPYLSVGYRLRAQGSVGYRDIASFNFGAWALFRGDPYLNLSSFRLNLGIKWNWGELTIGRNTRHWGLGMFFNSGNGFDTPFGENTGVSAFDQLQVVVNPINAANAEESNFQLTLGVSLERAVNDPLVGLERTIGPSRYTGLGVDDAATRDWSTFDVAERWQLTYFFTLGTSLERSAVPGVEFGGLIQHRLDQKLQGSLALGDVYLNARVNRVHFGAEFLAVWGDAMDRSTDPTASLGAVGVIGYLSTRRRFADMTIEAGYASSPLSSIDPEAYWGFSPDHQVGLILYPSLWGRLADSPPYGSVSESVYVFPWAAFRPMNGLEVRTGAVVIWPDKPSGPGFPCTVTEDCSPITPAGWELDLSFVYTPIRFLNFSLEAGYAQTTDIVAPEDAWGETSGRYWTIQSRAAFVF